MRRLFIGNIDEGTEQLNEQNTITAGNAKWFGDLNIGDWTFISERGSMIDKLLEVDSIDKSDPNNVTYHFKIIKKYDEPKKTNKILSCKFFEMNLVILNKALRPAWRGTSPHFFELIFNEKYKDIDISKVEFDDNNIRYIYVTEDIDKVLDKNEGDVYIVVSNKSNGYKIKEVIEYRGEDEYKRLNLKDISNTINIEQHGFLGAFEIAKENNQTSKKNLLYRIIAQLESNGYYIHPIDSNLSLFYDILIVRERNNEDSSEESGEDYIYIIKKNEPAEKDDEKGENIIVYGVPGSGKSYYINKKLMEKNKYNDKYMERVTFYPEYTYYDFVGQNIPKEDGNGLVFEEGNFTRILKKAIADSNHQYYLVIEEMNRGNAEAIFGDIFQLLDRDEQGKSQYTINNMRLKEAINEYLRKNDSTTFIDKVYIPSNLTIYATINNADQNVFNFDSAFGRRWEYKLMACDDRHNELKNDENKIYYEGYIKGTNHKWNVIREKINNIILESRDEIYNAEEKRLGLYYIDRKSLANKPDEIDGQEKESAEKFASKIFRYLYLNVFRNETNKKIFKGREMTLEDYINKFKDERLIENILNIDIGENNSNE